MPGCMAWVQEPSDMIKMRKEVQALSVQSVNITLIKQDSVLLERISVMHNGRVLLVSVNYAECHYAECCGTIYRICPNSNYGESPLNYLLGQLFTTC